jgi:hypothetical protein
MPNQNGVQFYVVYCCEHLRDGREEGAKIVGSIEEGITLINKWKANYIGGDNTEFGLFELGKEIPIELVKTEVPQPPLVTKQYRLKRRKKDAS